MGIEAIFDKKGFFRVGIDPYRCNREEAAYRYLFDEDGRAIRTDAARRFIERNGCSPFSDIVMYYYSHIIDDSCKGNYTAVYSWR